MSETNQENMPPKIVQDDTTLDTIDTETDTDPDADIGMVEKGMPVTDKKDYIVGVTTTKNPARQTKVTFAYTNTTTIGTLLVIAILIVTVGITMVRKANVEIIQSSSQDTASTTLAGWAVVCDKAETIVGTGNKYDTVVSTSFDFSESTLDLDLPLCAEIGESLGIWFKVVGTGVPISAAVSFTATSPVTMTIYKSTTDGSGCDHQVGTHLSCMTGDMVRRASSIDESMSGSDSACFATTKGEEYFIHLVTTTTSATLRGMYEEHTLQVGRCDLFNGLSPDADTAPPPDNDTCDTAETIVPEQDTVSTYFAFLGSTPDLDVPLCGVDNDATTPGANMGIWYKVVGTGIPVSAAVSFTATSPVTMMIYKSTTGSGGDQGAGLSCMTGDMVRASSIVESMNGSDSACFATTNGEEYFIHLLTTSATLEGMSEQHSLRIRFCESTIDLTLSPDNDLCDMSKTIVPAANTNKAFSLSFAVSVSVDDINLPFCCRTFTIVNGESNRGIFYNVVGTGVPVSVTLNYTTASPVGIWIYIRSSATTGNTSSSGCDNKGTDLSCFTHPLERTTTIYESTSEPTIGEETVCFDTIQGEEYYILLEKSAWTEEFTNEEHTMQVGLCQQ
jgi:hypothetical protein